MTQRGGAQGGEPPSFPRRQARTRSFSLGAPRALRVAPDGNRVAFLRSSGPEDPANALWLLDVTSGRERLVADPGADPAAEDLPPEERARRERAREVAGGIVAYATDAAVTRAVYALAGRLHVADLAEGTTWALDRTGTVLDPRLDPSGARIAYVTEGALRVTSADGGEPRTLVEPDGESVTWGLAEFIAAEEMGRSRGFWWAPDGQRIAVARVDTAPIGRWHIADPAEPGRAPQVVAYPAAGTANADVRLFVVDLDGPGSEDSSSAGSEPAESAPEGPRREVVWDRARLPYLVDVVWEAEGPLTLVVQSRDQRTMEFLAADPGTGTTRIVRVVEDPAWVEIVGGVPRWLPDGRLLHTHDEPEARRLAVDGTPFGPADLHVRRVVDAGQHDVLVVASREPTAPGLWSVPLDGTEATCLSGAGEVADGARGGGTLVLARRSLDWHGARVEVSPGGAQDDAADQAGTGRGRQIRSFAADPGLDPRVKLCRLGARELPAALLLPRGFEPGEGPLPVLLDPYGGPHAQRVLRARGAYLTSQWFADQGFAVLVVDGRGMAGRGPAWERQVTGDLASAPLEDQVDALHAAAERFPFLDLERVAIRGWSFGGFLAALAVLRRPDVFAAAIAGAPVTDWALYDTHYTERYLGLPEDEPEAYRSSSLIADAPALRRPLLLVHGLADDNVVAAHTLRLSRALLEHGRPHRVLPLSGVTHMTPQEVVAENLLLLQRDFLFEALGVDGRYPGESPLPGGPSRRT